MFFKSTHLALIAISLNLFRIIYVKTENSSEHEHKNENSTCKKILLFNKKRLNLFKHFIKT